MVYIRIKNIAKNKYAYVARSVQTKKGSRQKIVKYLGRVYELGMNGDVAIGNISAKTPAKFLLELVIPYLKEVGFRENKKNFVHKNMVFSCEKLSLTKAKTTKSIVLKVNEGYLCSFTLSRILKLKKSKDVGKDATMLATYFHRAGFEISEENFITYYQLL